MSRIKELFPGINSTNANGKRRVLGIDLGTTISVAADLKWDPQQPEHIVADCLELQQETLEGIHTHHLLPSVVALFSNKLFVGEGAKRLRAQTSYYNLKQNKDLFYECKNDMGVDRTYHMARPGFQYAYEVGSKVLDFFYQAALQQDATPIDRVVITVPASFQVAQRHDTAEAARLAGLDIKSNDLMDEPVAAFLEYMMSQADESLLETGEAKNLVVFDFGGGTCDVAVFRLSKTKEGILNIASLSVSRYHRIGGGDIDRSIIHECLIPQILEQNNLSKYGLSFDDKKNYLEPALLGIAESLKIKISRDIDRLKKFNRYEGQDLEEIRTVNPAAEIIKLKDRELTLNNLSLTAAQFEEVLKPFLDEDLLYYQESEYYIACSVFAPLQDAVQRGGLSLEEIDLCLMVGGSSNIPQIREAVTRYFPEAKLLNYAELDSYQTAMARGAAYNALSLCLFNTGIFKPVCNEPISIRSSAGLVELIPQGVQLPYPPTGSLFNRNLTVPMGSMDDPVQVRVEILGGSDTRLLLCNTWNISAPVRQGDPLCLEYAFDENQVLTLYLAVDKADASNQVFSEKVDRPLTNVVNPNAVFQSILEMEEAIRTEGYSRLELAAKMTELAKYYAELKHYEKAIEILKRVLLIKQGPDAGLLHSIGLYYGYLGDDEREEKFYWEAAANSMWQGPLFNLTLSKKKRKKIVEAIETIDAALKRTREGPYLVLRAELAREQGEKKDVDELLEEAFDNFDPPELLDEWELAWYLSGARMMKDNQKIEAAVAEGKRRNIKTGVSSYGIGGLLPDLSTARGGTN